MNVYDLALVDVADMIDGEDGGKRVFDFGCVSFVVFGEPGNQRIAFTTVDGKAGVIEH